MAKQQQFPGISTGRGPLAKVIGIALVIAVLVLVVKHPTDAAAFAKAAFSTCGDAIDGIVTFLRSL